MEFSCEESASSTLCITENFEWFFLTDFIIIGLLVMIFISLLWLKH